MTPEIKQRIELIQRGEVPEGYQKTKAGIVPQDWRIVKLSDVLKKQSAKNKSNSLHIVLTNSATQGIVCQTDYFDKQIANDENTDGYYIVEPGYFVYNPRISVTSPCGPFNRYNGNAPGIMSPLYSVYAHRNNAPISSDYLAAYYSSSHWYAYMYSIANYGARSDRMNVTSDDMNSMPLPMPLFHEQQQIVEILSTQDKVIALLEQEVEQFRLLKKSCLSKMFSKRGESIPKIRFPGFADAWEQRKFSDFSWASGKRNKDNLDLEAYAITNESGFIPQAEAHEDFGYMKDTDRSAYIIVTPKSFAYNPARINVGSIGYYEGTKNVIVSSLYEVFQIADYVNHRFLWHWLKSAELPWWIHRLQEGSVRLYFFYDKLRECQMNLPSLPEQRKIAEALDSIDDLITLYQRKLEAEKQKKKALMQLLLTGIVRV